MTEAADAGAIEGEVLPIEREELRQRVALSDADERGVGQIHRQVAMLLHQLPHARRVG